MPRDNLKLIRKEVGRQLVRAGMTRSATLIVVTQGARDPSNLSAGRTLTETSVPCRGLVITWKKQYLNATLIEAGDRVVLLTGLSLKTTVPKPSDKISIEGVTSRIIDVDRDPAHATYACLTRS